MRGQPAQACPVSGAQCSDGCAPGNRPPSWLWPRWAWGKARRGHSRAWGWGGRGQADAAQGPALSCLRWERAREVSCVTWEHGQGGWSGLASSCRGWLLGPGLWDNMLLLLSPLWACSLLDFGIHLDVPESVRPGAEPRSRPSLGPPRWQGLVMAPGAPTRTAQALRWRSGSWVLRPRPRPSRS